MTKDQEKIWRYLLEDRLATAEEVSKQTSVDLKTVRQVMGYIGTPKHVIEKEIKENRCQTVGAQASFAEIYVSQGVF